MKRNYLSKVVSVPDQRAYKRFKCNAAVWLVYKLSAKQPLVSCRAIIVNISQGGALLSVAAGDIPDYFYIVIGRHEYSIGCVTLRKNSNQITLEFIKEQPQRLIEAFALLSFPMAPLFSFKGLMRNKIIQETTTDTQPQV